MGRARSLPPFSTATDAGRELGYTEAIGNYDALGYERKCHINQLLCLLLLSMFHLVIQKLPNSSQRLSFYFIGTVPNCCTKPLLSAEGWLRNEDGTWGGGGRRVRWILKRNQYLVVNLAGKSSHSFWLNKWRVKGVMLKLCWLLRRFSFLSLYPFFQGDFGRNVDRRCLGRKFASHRRHRRPITGSPRRRFTFGRWSVHIGKYQLY